MSKNLSRNSKLLVISDTGMYEQDGKIYAFGPVVHELECFLKAFDSITWIGFNRLDQKNNKAYKEVSSKAIRLIPLKQVGGRSLFSKLKVLYQYPKMFYTLIRELNRHAFVHCRAPSQPAFLSMFLTLFYSKKQFWFKYAGSWVDKTSFSYDFQRRVLKVLPSHVKVTVNGSWENQKASVITFENPCLSLEERSIGYAICQEKELQQPANYCFVGNLDANKGADLLLEVFKRYSSKTIGSLHIVGDGVLRKALEQYIEFCDFKIIFHGFLSKEALVEIYKDCHFIILPSKSEGFPKVIAEAMNYGCVPVVTNVSCIGQYVIDKKNGFLIQEAHEEYLEISLQEVFKTTASSYQKMKNENYKLAEKFTYEYYLSQVYKYIFAKS